MAKIKYSVYNRLFIRVVLPSIILLVIVEIFNYYIIKKSMNEASRRKSDIILNEVRTLQAFQDKTLGLIEENLDKRMKAFSDKLVNYYFSSTDSIEKADLSSLRKELNMNNKLEDIYIINEKGIVINTTFKDDFLLNFFSFGKEHEEYLRGIFDSPDFVSENFAIEQNTKRLKRYSYQSTRDKKYIVELGTYSIDADNLIEFVANHLHSLSKIDESIVTVDLFIGADKPFSLFSKTKQTNEENKVLHEVFKHRYKNYVYDQYENSNMSAEYMYIPRKNSKLYKGSVIKIVYDSTSEKTRLRIDLLKSVVFSLIICFIIFWILLERTRYDIVNPMDKLLAALRHISAGNIAVAHMANVKVNNEFGEMGQHVDGVILILKNAINFAKEIGKGNFSVDFKLSHKTDIVGRTLKDMQTNLIHIEVEKKLRDKEDEKNKWFANGINEFSHILRESTENIRDLSQKIISNLVNYIDAVQGAVFISDDLNTENITIELVASYAYNQERHIEKRIRPGEGLVGMCFIEKYTIYRTEIPDNYTTITSGLGEANPSCILVVPLKLQEQIFGVIELASFNKFEATDIDFVEKIAESVSYTLSTVRINTKTKELLEQSRKQSILFSHKEKELLDKIDSMQLDVNEANTREALLYNELQLRMKDLEIANDKIAKFRQIQLLHQAGDKIIPQDIDKEQF